MMRNRGTVPFESIAASDDSYAAAATCSLPPRVRMRRRKSSACLGEANTLLRMNSAVATSPPENGTVNCLLRSLKLHGCHHTHAAQQMAAPNLTALLAVLVPVRATLVDPLFSIGAYRAVSLLQVKPVRVRPLEATESRCFTYSGYVCAAVACPRPTARLRFFSRLPLIPTILLLLPPVLLCSVRVLSTPLALSLGCL
jgi:hypothetical protein